MSVHIQKPKCTQSTVHISTDIFQPFVKLFPCCQKSMSDLNLMHMFRRLTAGKTLEKSTQKDFAGYSLVVVS